MGGGGGGVAFVWPLSADLPAAVLAALLANSPSNLLDDAALPGLPLLADGGAAPCNETQFAGLPHSTEEITVGGESWVLHAAFPPGSRPLYSRTDQCLDVLS